MRSLKRSNKGQFFVIAALLVSVILVGGVISTYTLVRNSPLEDSPKVLSYVSEMNSDIKSILDFTVGYYGSILKVTGSYDFAQERTNNYLSSGLLNIANSHPDWNPSFVVNNDATISTRWFMPYSYSMGNVNVTYSLGSLGIEGMTYYTSSALTVEMLPSANPDYAIINVTRDNSEPDLSLNEDKFQFYKYDYEHSTWGSAPADAVSVFNELYNITIPEGIDKNAYSVQIEDSRGIVVSAFYSPESVAPESAGIPHYTYSLDWNYGSGIWDIYEDLSTDNFVIELLQNGTLRWLGQPLDLASTELPIPPVSIKAFRINATTITGNDEIPFQVEDWGSDYMVPFGLSSNESIFGNDNMFAFLVNNTVSEITLWWEGNDTSIQTPFAWRNEYFTDDVTNPSLSYGSLNNGLVELRISKLGNLVVQSSTVPYSSPYIVDFSRVNNDGPDCGSGPSFVIANGVVRDIVQHEPEYSGFPGGVSGCPNFYAQVFITFPAGSTYYTYSMRTIFVESDQSRTITDLSTLQLSGLSGTPTTENGTVAIYPNPYSTTGTFSDSSPTGWDHHWSQYVSGNEGVGIMFTNSSNEQLYVFDEGTNNGAVVVDSSSIEVNPVELDSESFTTAKDLTWYGAVATFDSEPIYHSGDDIGLWVMVEYPPNVTLDQHWVPSDTDIDYVNNNLSNEDMSADKGNHSVFSAQKYGPDAIYDTLTEENFGVLVNSTVLVDGFENSPWDVYWNNVYSAWREDNYPTHGGSSSAWASNNDDGYFTSDNIDVSDASAIYVDFWLRKNNIGSSDFTLYYYDGSNYDYIEELDNNGGDNTWIHYTAKITDSQYFVSNFRIRFDATLGWDEEVWVDDVVVTKEVQISDNYNLDLEVQWTHANYEQTNEELCIYVGEVSSENLRVEVWTGSGWDELFSSLNVGWNNATVSSYLTSEEFTIRFVGSTETGDATQDYWTIDATLLHTWS